MIVLINSYIFVFIFSGISLLLLKGNAPINRSELTVSYISIITFILLIPMTFFCSFLLVKSLSINDIIDEYLKKLSFDNIFLLDFGNKIIPSEEDKKRMTPMTEVVDKDCLETIYKLLINQLNSENIVKAQIILNKVSDKFTEFIFNKEEQELKSNTKFHQLRFAHFLVSLNNETKVNSKSYKKFILEKELEIVRSFYFEYNNRKLKLSNLEPFREAFFSKIISTYLGDEEFMEKILKTIAKVLESTINNNLPSEKAIMHLDLDYRIENNLGEEEITLAEEEKNYAFRRSWKNITENYPKYFSDQLSFSIDEKNERVFLRNLSIYRRCVFNLSWVPIEKNKYLKSRWIIINFTELIRFYKSAIRRELIFRIDGNDLVFHSDITDLFKNNEICARKILVDYLQFIIWLNKQGKLNYITYCGIYSMGDWGSIYWGSNLTMLGSFFLEKYHDEIQYRNGFEDVLTAIEIIFDDYRKGIVSEEVNLNTMLSVLSKLKKNYISARKNKSKSQRVLRRINKVNTEIEMVLKNE